MGQVHWGIWEIGLFVGLGPAFSRFTGNYTFFLGQNYVCTKNAPFCDEGSMFYVLEPNITTPWGDCHMPYDELNGPMLRYSTRHFPSILSTYPSGKWLSRKTTDYSLRPIDAYMCQYNRSSLVQIMASRLFGEPPAKNISEYFSRNSNISVGAAPTTSSIHSQLNTWLQWIGQR